MKFKIKSICIFLIILLCSFLLVSCNGKNEGPSFSRNSMDDNAVLFMQSLCDEEYAKTISLAYFPNSSYFTPDDIASYMSSSSYSELKAIKDSVSEIKSDGTPDDAWSSDCILVQLYDEDEKVIGEYTIYFKETEDNLWKVDISEFYITDWYFYATGGNTQLYIDDNVVDDISYNKVADKYVSQHATYNQYIFGAIGKGAKTFSITSDSFEETSVTLTPGIDNDYILRKEMTSEESTPVLNDIMDSWNSLYSLYADGSASSSASDILASGIDDSLCDSLWTDFAKLSENGTDFKITQIYPLEGSTCFYYTDTLVVANFGYDISWNEGNTSLTSSIILRYEDDKYKICIVPYEKLFYFVK